MAAADDGNSRALVPVDEAARSPAADDAAAAAEAAELAALKTQMSKMKEREAARHAALEEQWRRFEAQDEHYRTLEARQAKMDEWSYSLIQQVKAETQRQIAAELEEKRRQEMALLEMPEKSAAEVAAEEARQTDKVQRLRETEPRRDLHLRQELIKS